MTEKMGIDYFYINAIFIGKMLELGEILNCFDSRETNVSAESLNSKMKCFRSSLRGVRDIPYFFYRSVMVFG